MENQKCPSCSAPMHLINNSDGTDSYVCDYCGSVINNRPKTTSDKVFSFINRAINALKDNSEDKLTPEQKAIRDAVNERNALIHQQYLEKRMRQAQKSLEKQKRKLGK